MARWPKPKPRRDVGWRRWLLVGVGITAFVATLYWYQPQLLHSPIADAVDSLTTPLTPSLYGSPERDLAIPGAGVGVLVEDDASSPLAVILTRGANGIAEHAGIQAMLERAGVASLALVLPADSAGAAALTRWVAQVGAARRHPVRLVIPGSLLDQWLALSFDSSIPLLVLGPVPPHRTLREVWLTRFRFLSDTVDSRLVGWDDAAVVVGAGDTLAARRLVRSATRARLVVLTGETADPPSPHPDASAWREVIAILRGYWEGMVEVEVSEPRTEIGEP